MAAPKNPNKIDGPPIVSLFALPRFIRATPIYRGIMIWGPSGIGKSAVISQLAEAEGGNLIDLRMSLLDPIDIRGVGMPDEERGVTRWYPPEFLPREKNTYLFLDEINAAPPSIQAAGYQMIYDRRVGEHIFPEDTRIIAAGNRESDKGVIYRMPAPLANRFVHFEVKADIISWRAWAFKNRVYPEIIAFLTDRPDFLHDMDSENSDKAWPSPRSWVYASEFLSSDFLDKKEKEIAVSACVGKNAALVFNEFSSKIYNMPNVLEVLEKDGKSPPSEISTATAMTFCIALAANCQEEDAQINRVLIYASRLRSEESQALLVNSMEEKYGLSRLSSFKVFEKLRKLISEKVIVKKETENAEEIPF